MSALPFTYGSSLTESKGQNDRVPQDDSFDTHSHRDKCRTCLPPSNEPNPSSAPRQMPCGASELLGSTCVRSRSRWQLHGGGDYGIDRAGWRRLRWVPCWATPSRDFEGHRKIVSKLITTQQSCKRSSKKIRDHIKASHKHSQHPSIHPSIHHPIASH